MSCLDRAQIDYLEGIKKAGGRHASNILTKYEKEDSQICDFVADYIDFSTVLDSVAENRRESFAPYGGRKWLQIAVAALNRYKDYVEEHTLYSFEVCFHDY